MSLGKDHAVEIDKQQAMDFLKSHNRFLLVGHEHPDGDDVGSICALHNVLLSMGKEATWFFLIPCRECTPSLKHLHRS